MKNIFFSLKVQLFLLVLLPIMLVGGLISAKLYVSIYEDADKQLASQGKLFVSLISKLAEFGVYSADVQSLDNTLSDVLLKLENVVKVVVHDKKGVLLSKQKPTFNETNPYYLRFTELIKIEPFEGATLGNQALQIGKVTIFLSKESLYAEFKDNFQFNVLIILLVCSVAILLVSVLIIRVTKPMSQLVSQTQQIEQGNYQVITPIHTWIVEITELFESFMRMSKAVSDSVRDLEDKIELRTQELQMSNQQKQFLLKRLNSAIENERRKIANDIHDQLNASLIGIRMILMSLTNKTTDDVFKKHLLHCIEQINALYQMGREIAKTMRPEALDTLGLVHAINEMLIAQKALFPNCDYSFQHEDLEKLSHDELKINIYRLLQEALSNIAKHAAASKVAVSISVLSAKVYLTIQDNGLGFNVNQSFHSQGLLSMKERVQDFNGVFNICSDANGTVIKVVLPAE